jgi:hypothetical protein
MHFLDYETFNEIMMMMLNFTKMILMIIEPKIRMMYYPMMINYVIVYVLLLVDFEPIPNTQKRSMYLF